MTTHQLAHQTAHHIVEPLAHAKARYLDPALAWVRSELEIARRENQDAQFLATTKGDGYIRRV